MLVSYTLHETKKHTNMGCRREDGL